MTDEEILDRVATIENCEWTSWKMFMGHDQYEELTGWSHPLDQTLRSWNPLICPQDLLPLIERHRVHIDPWLNRPCWRCSIVNWDGEEGAGPKEGYGKDESLPRAVLLAIIDAYWGKPK